MGNKASTWATLAATNHSSGEREKNDFYATEPRAVELLLEQEKFSNKILEPCCGEGHISEVLKRHGYEVDSFDKVDRGYGRVEDLFNLKYAPDTDIITNPPYLCGLDCVKHSLEAIDKGHKVAMFLKIQFLEGKERKKFFEENPPKVVYVSSSRLNCAKNGEFEKYKSSAVCYAWFVWEKGYKGDTIIKWIN